MWQWPTESITETGHLTTTRKVAKELTIDHSTVIWHLKQSGKVKKLENWVPRERTTNKKKKNHHFEVTPSLSLCNESYFLIGLRCVMCDEKWILHANRQWTAQWLDQKEAPKHFPKPTKKKKRSWTLFSGLLPIWSTTAFWILAKPLYLRGMLSKSMRCTPKTATPAASTDQQKGPNSFPWQHQTTHRTTK